MVPYSHDLNPCDFFLWGYLRDRVYRGNPNTINQLKKAIENEIKAISKASCKATIEGF